MVVVANNEKEYVKKYLSALQGMMGFSPRELEIAIIMVQKYILLLDIQSRLKTEKARKEFDPFQELKKPETLAAFTKELNMSFSVFRNYISSLKSKGFFKNSSINPVCIPGKEEAVIKFTLRK